MSNAKLQKVKEVNGWKVNHPHSAPNIVYGIFSLIYVAFPLCLFFVPLIATAPGLNGVDLFKFFIEFWKGFTTGNSMPISAEMNPLIAGICLSVKPEVLQATYYLFVVAAGFMYIFLVFSLIKFLYAIIHLGKGYLRKSCTMKGFAITEFIMSFLLLGIMLFFYICVKFSTEESLAIWYSLIPVGVSLFFMILFSIMYHKHFKDTIFEGDLEYHEDEPVVEHLTKVHEVRKVKYEQSSTLPPNLKSIGGHAFAENQSLIVANIPLEITKIGPGAFANCLNLQVVSIPTSVKEIGFNCFFNCVELERINYGGTKAEWKKIRRGSNWLAKAKTSEVVCQDGTVVVNPYH